MKSTTWNTQIIERRQIVTIYKFINTLTDWTIPLYLSFIPDEVIVKYYSYGFDGTEAGVSLLYTDLINDIICPIVDKTSGYLDTHYLLQKPVSGTYSFQVRNPLGALTNIREGDIVLALEFVKYKDENQVKIY